MQGNKKSVSGKGVEIKPGKEILIKNSPLAYKKKPADFDRQHNNI